MTAQLVYAARMACAALPPLIDPDDGDRTLQPGLTWACPDCGAVWAVRAIVNWGGPSDVQWTCLYAPGITNPTQDRLAALEKRVVSVRRAQPAVLAIAVNKSIEVVVTWKTPFVDPVYDIEVLLPAALVGKLTPSVKAGSQTKAGLTLVLTASAVVVAGSVLDVTATRFGAPA